MGLLLLAQVRDMMDWSSGGWLWMTLMMIGGAVLIVVVVFLLLRGTSGGMGFGSGNTPRESPLDVAKRRYAAGEITAEEFEKIKRGIEGPGS